MGRKNNNPRRNYSQQSGSNYADLMKERNKFVIDFDDFILPQTRHKARTEMDYISIPHSANKERLVIVFSDKSLKKIKSERIGFGIFKNSNGDERLYIYETSEGYLLTSSGVSAQKRNRISGTLGDGDAIRFLKFCGYHESLMYDSENCLYYFEPIKKGE